MVFGNSAQGDLPGKASWVSGPRSLEEIACWLLPVVSLLLFMCK